MATWQVAIAEARNLVESGNRVAFFASSTGEVERVADILNEYRIPYQLGLEQFDSTPPTWPNARTWPCRCQHLRGQGAHPPRHGLPRFAPCSFWLRRPVRNLGTGGPCLGFQIRAGHFFADLIDLKPGDYVVHAEHGVAQYLGLREIAQGEPRAITCSSNTPPAPSSTCPSPAWTWSSGGAAGRCQAALDRMGGVTWSRTKTASRPKCATWRTSCSALRRPQNGGGLSVFPR